MKITIEAITLFVLLTAAYTMISKQPEYSMVLYLGLAIVGGYALGMIKPRAPKQ